MPSLKKFREMTGLPDTVRRWNDAAKIVKAGQQSLVDQEKGYFFPTMISSTTEQEGVALAVGATHAVRKQALSNPGW